MTELCRLIVPWDVARSSPNARMSWQEKHRTNTTARQWANYAWVQAGEPRAAGRVRVMLVARRAKAMDWDNIVAACKPILDGLFKQAITPDDSPNWIAALGVMQETGKEHKGAESVEVIVYTVETQP